MARRVDSAGTSLSQQYPWVRLLRIGVIWLLVLVGSLAFGTYVVVRWVEVQILDTDNWVTLVSSLPQQESVSTALGDYITSKVFSDADVQQKIANALPPQAAFLASPLTNQLHMLTSRAAQRLVTSDTFQAVWGGANRLAMNRLVTVARSQSSPLETRVNQRFNIDLSDTISRLRERLGTLSAAIPSLQQPSRQALVISTDLRLRADRLHQLIRTIDTLAAVLPMAIIAAVLWAIVLSHRPRRTLFILLGAIFVLMLVELIALRALRGNVLDQVQNQAYMPAVGDIYDTLVGWLRGSIYWVIGGLVVVAALNLLAGPAEWAVQLRSFVHLDRLRLSRAATWWRTLREWVRRWRYYLALAVLIVVLGGLALFVPVTSQSIINACLLVVVICALICGLAQRQPVAT